MPRPGARLAPPQPSRLATGSPRMSALRSDSGPSQRWVKAAFSTARCSGVLRPLTGDAPNQRSQAMRGLPTLQTLGLSPGLD